MPSDTDSRASDPAIVVRYIKFAPFCWQHKSALRLIRESFDADKTVASTLAVYHGLTEIASDKSSEIFQTTHAWIALMSGVSIRTVESRLADLVGIGLIHISTPALKTPSTYTMLPVPQPLPNVPQPAEMNQLPSSEQNQKKEIKTLSTKASKLSTRQKDLADWMESLLGVQWVNDAGKWVNRIKAHPKICEPVIAEVDNAKKEGRINTTPAQFAEQIWKEFAPGLS